MAHRLRPRVTYHETSKNQLKSFVMSNRKFSSESKYISNETVYNIVPDVLGINNLQATVVKNNYVCNTSSVSIPNFPPMYIFPSGPFLKPCSSTCNIQTYREFLPNGVVFSFKSVPRVVKNPCPCNTPTQQYPQPMVYCTQTSPAVEVNNVTKEPPLFYQTPCHQAFVTNPNNLCFSDPVKFKFHKNSETSTNDLLENSFCQVPLSRGHPDFEQLSGIVADMSNRVNSMIQSAATLESPSIVVEKHARLQLILGKNPDLAETCESIRERDKAQLLNQKDQQTETNVCCKKVSFSDDDKNPDEEKKNEKPKRRNKKAKKPRGNNKKRHHCGTKSDEADESSSDDSDGSQDNVRSK